MRSRGRAATVFGAALRRARERAGLTQTALGRELDVARAQVSQWETGVHTPTAEYLQRLDRFFEGAGLGDLLAEARAAAAGPDIAPQADGGPEEPGALTVLDVHRALGKALVDSLVRDEDGRPVGWRRDFDDAYEPSAFTTASGSRALLMLHDPPYVDRHALGEALLAHHVENGGWRTQTFGLRPEATAVIIDALDRLGAPLDVDRSLDELGAMMDTSNRVHTYVLAEALSISARLRPGSELATSLAEDLLANQDSSGGWPEKRPAVAKAFSLPSTAHTARVLTVLVHAVDRGLPDPDGRMAAAIGAAQAWLEEHHVLLPVRENVSPAGSRDLEIRHFTPALVAHAMASVPSPSWPLLRTAVARVWAAYNPALGRWQWPNGDVPVWLQLDAIRAVTVAHSRLTRAQVTP